MTIYTYQRITDMLDEIVDEYGRDFVRTRGGREPVYAVWPDGSTPSDEDLDNCGPDDLVPSCIVGQLLYRLEPELLRRAGWTHNSHNVHSLFHEVIHKEFPVAAEPILLRALQAAQELQDHGWPWGEALDRFKQRTEECSDKTAFTIDTDALKEAA